MSAKDHSQIQMGLALDEMQSALRKFQKACDQYHKALVQSQCTHQWTHKEVDSVLDNFSLDSWHCDKCNMTIFFDPESSNEQ